MLTVSLLIALSNPSPTVFTLEGRKHGHSYQVTLKQANFAPRGRKVVWAPSYGQKAYRPAYLDGWRKRQFWGYPNRAKSDIQGLDASRIVSKSTELTSLVVSVDGKEWPSSGWLYRTFHNPNFDGAVSLRLANDGQSLSLKMTGGQGAGAYCVEWTLREDGLHTMESSGTQCKER